MSQIAQRREAPSPVRTAPIQTQVVAETPATAPSKKPRQTNEKPQLRGQLGSIWHPITSQAHEQCTGDGVDESRVKLFQGTGSKAIKLQARACPPRCHPPPVLVAQFSRQ
eukprot:1900067-Amphidinium_carterae.3